ncbi:MAG: hypothetical protein AB8G05_20825 [Oligoflexales bacterium]
MKKLISLVLLYSQMSATHALGINSCEDFFLLNLAPGSVCATRTNKTLYKEKDSFSIVNSTGKGFKLYIPSTNQELTLPEARDFCKSQGLRLPSVKELQEFVDETFSARLGGITSCQNVNRSFFNAEATSDQGSKNIIPLEGKAILSQEDFEIAAFDFSSNTAVVRYEQQKFNASCIENVDQAPTVEIMNEHDCSEYWLASAELGISCKLEDGVSLTKTISGFAFSDGNFVSKPEKYTNVSSLNEGQEYCANQSMNLLSSKTLDYLLKGITDKETARNPQIFCVAEFAGSETAIVDDLYSNSQIEWNFTYNSTSSSSGSLIGYRVVCEQ